MPNPKRYLTKGLQASLDDLALEEGKLRFTTDSGRLFLDHGNRRVEISDFVRGFTEYQIRNIITPLPKFYYAKDSNKFFYHNGAAWIQVNSNVAYAENTNYANQANSANYADYAGESTNASTAEYSIEAAHAENASTAEYADSASNASTAEYSTKALLDANDNQFNTTYAPLASPLFTGTPSVPTAEEGNNSQQIANTAFVLRAITSAIADVSQFNATIVESLPTIGSYGTIYFVLNDGDEEGNIYDEYLWINSKYELMGTTKLDLTGYFHELSVSGTGNAITQAIQTEDGIEFVKGATFLTSHPSVTKDSSTATETPSGGSVIEMIDSVVVDDYGHLIAFRKKSVTLPNSVSNASTAQYAVSAASADSALKDNIGQQIDSTYLKNANVAGKNIIFTRGNGATFSFQSQDTEYNNYRGATSTSDGVAGLVPPATISERDYVLKGDGTWGEVGTSEYSSNAGTASYAQTAYSAGSALNAGTSDYAINAENSTNASTANYAETAQFAHSLAEDAELDFGDLDEDEEENEPVEE